MIIDHIGDFINSRRYSSITTSNPDPIQYPDYYKAIRHEVILNEGDMLYIPFGWFHHVFSEDVNSNTKVNLAINFWKHTTKDEYSVSIKDYSEKNIKKYNCVISNDEYLDYNESNFPFITSHSCNKFSFSNFYESMSNIPLYYQTSKTTIFESDLVSKEISNDDDTYILDEFLQTNNSKSESESKYIAQNNIMKYKDFDWIKSITPPFFDNFDEINLWMNKGHISSTNHYDSYDNILCQLQGTKRIFLFPPSERYNLYLHNRFNLQFILNTYKKLNELNKSVNRTQDIYIKTYDSSIEPSICKLIINSNKNFTQVIDISPELDNVFFKLLNKSILSYINYIIDTQNKIPLIQDCVDSGYFIHCLNSINDSQKYPYQLDNTILKYMWFLNDSTPVYINGIEIEAKAGRLLIYPAHFTYIEKEIDTVKNKWICYGYFYHPRRDSNPQSHD